MAKPDVTGSQWADEEEWRVGMRKLSDFTNVWCKLSGFYAGK